MNHPPHPGLLIHRLRTERGLTQKQLAESLHVSDKAVSKWERGQGLPDVSLLRALGAELGVSLEPLLAGELARNGADGGNMKRIQFYACPDCGGLLTATGKAQISCCGRSLEPLKASPCDEAHGVTASPVEYDLYLTFEHEMSKSHYISFAAVVSYDRVMLVKLYPEQASAVRLPDIQGGATVYLYCSQHGLWQVPSL